MTKMKVKRERLTLDDEDAAPVMKAKPKRERLTLDDDDDEEEAPRAPKVKAKRERLTLDDDEPDDAPATEEAPRASKAKPARAAANVDEPELPFEDPPAPERAQKIDAPKPREGREPETVKAGTIDFVDAVFIEEGTNLVFVELEKDGKSVNIGQWYENHEGFKVLRIPVINYVDVRVVPKIVIESESTKRATDPVPEPESKDPLTELAERGHDEYVKLPSPPAAELNGIAERAAETITKREPGPVHKVENFMKQAEASDHAAAKTAWEDDTQAVKPRLLAWLEHCGARGTTNTEIANVLKLERNRFNSRVSELLRNQVIANIGKDDKEVRFALWQFADPSQSSPNEKQNESAGSSEPRP